MLFSAPIQKSATPRHEAKFCLPSSRVHATRAWLRHRYAFDAEYPNNMIHSLYYDTPDYALLQQKQASEYLKAKIRVRWYSDPRTGEVSDAAFLEIKAKEGVRSHKIRTPWPLTGKTMMQDPFTEARQVRLNSIIPDDWPRLNDWYRPTAVISYTRDRFSNAEKSLRIALDTNIHCTGVNSICAGFRPRRPRNAILEVKGTNVRALPRELYGLNAFGVHKIAFSKYLECLSPFQPLETSR